MNVRPKRRESLSESLTISVRYEHRDYRHAVKLAAREHHGRLVSDFEKAKDYYATARELASEAHGSEPQFTDKERINLEIYAERQNDAALREKITWSWPVVRARRRIARCRRQGAAKWQVG